MTTAKALRLIRQNKPVTPKDWENLGFTFEYLGTGVFRETFHIKGTDLVVKSPLLSDGNYSEGIAHSRTEMKRLDRLSRSGILKVNLPKVYYYDPKHGQIVMKYYPPLPEKDCAILLGKVIQSLVYKVAKIRMSDIYLDNLRLKRKDWQVCVFIDLGY